MSPDMAGFSVMVTLDSESHLSMKERTFQVGKQHASRSGRSTGTSLGSEEPLEQLEQNREACLARCLSEPALEE